MSKIEKIDVDKIKDLGHPEAIWMLLTMVTIKQNEIIDYLNNK